MELFEKGPFNKENNRKYNIYTHAHYIYIKTKIRARSNALINIITEIH